jgi:hypothetical protein
MSKLEEKGKILKKTNLGIKRVLGNNVQQIKEEIIVVGNGVDKTLKENSASFLLKLIIKAYYLSTWKKKIKALKYYSRKTNKQRMNFKKLISEISQVINQCKSKYFDEIYNKIDKLPVPQNVRHDKNFGTLSIINKDVLYKKNLVNNKTNVSNNNDILKYMVPEYINVINERKNNINLNEDRYTENYADEINLEDKEKGPDYDNNFNEVEYNENEEDITTNYNINKDSQNYIQNEVEEDIEFQNYYDYNQENANNYNNVEEEYYPENNYYYNSEQNYDNNYKYNMQNDYYYQNQDNYYYNEPYDENYQNEEENYNYDSANKIDLYKNVGNNVIISDIYVKPKIDKNNYQYNYNPNNYGYINNSNIYRTKMNTNKRAFPFSTHNHVFYISK